MAFQSLRLKLMILEAGGRGQLLYLIVTSLVTSWLKLALRA